jgi:rhodanese-related sulfurtransferase
MKKSITWKQFGAIFLILVGIILAFSPVDYGSIIKADAEAIARQIIDREDHVTAEQLGHLIIDKDPDYLLIDVRKVSEFNDFHIKTAVNIPLEELFKPEYLTSLDPEKFIILYSNGGTHAAQAWVLLKQKGFNNAAVLLGGLNYWVDVYSNPTPPDNVHADSEIFRYQFLKSAGPYLLGDGQIKSESAEPENPMPLKPFKRKKKKKSGDEGC